MAQEWPRQPKGLVFVADPTAYAQKACKMRFFLNLLVGFGMLTFPSSADLSSTWGPLEGGKVFIFREKEAGAQ